MTLHVPPSPPSTHDTTRVDDLRIAAVRPLITPALLQEWLPTPASAQAVGIGAAQALVGHMHHAPVVAVVVRHVAARAQQAEHRPLQRWAQC